MRNLKKKKRDEKQTNNNLDRDVMYTASAGFS